MAQNGRRGKVFSIALAFLAVFLVVAAAPVSAQEKAGGSRDNERLLDLAELLKQKEKELAAREAALNEKEKGLELLQQEIKKQEAKLSEIRTAQEKAMSELKSLKEEDLSRLVEVYSSMKPDAAAPLLSKLELKYAVEIILRMPTKKAAKLLSAVSPEKATEISRAITQIKPIE